MQEVEKIALFLQQVFAHTGKHKAVVAVSGGIDSAVVLALVTRALDVSAVTPLLLPHHNQPMDDAKTLLAHLGFLPGQEVTIDIKPLVDAIARPLHLEEEQPNHDQVRRGNVKARVRMICVFDLAKQLDALVVGTENKTEQYLGYFTRFGDAASDIEPLSHLYKTQVRQMAADLGLPAVLLTKAPSAGLWQGQTDEEEFGFSYEQADAVLEHLVDQHVPPEKISLPDVPTEIIERVCARVAANAFKQQVPYHL